jgi:DNA polymerase elongation subunit (family B)
MPKKENRKSKNTKRENNNLRFQIVDYYDQDRTNEHLGISNHFEPTVPSSDASYVDKKIISWWNWCKNTLYPQVNNYRLYLFGRTETQKSICTHVTEFQPYMYVRLPNKWKQKSKEYNKFKEWIIKELWLNNRFVPKKIPKYDPATRSDKTAFTDIDYKNIPVVGDPNNRKCPLRWKAFYKCIKTYNLINEMLYLVGIDRFTFVKRKILNEFVEGRKYPCVRIVCNSKKGFNRIKGIFQHNKNETWDNYEATPTEVTLPECGLTNHIFPLCEADINPICRFTDHANIKGCGWASVITYNKPSVDFTKCDIDIEASWKNGNIYPLEKDGLASMVMAFYDIECDSSHGEFPLAKKKYTMTINEILTEFQRLYTLKSVQHELRIRIADAESNGDVYVLSTRQQNVMNIKVPKMDVHFIKDLLRYAFTKGNDAHNISKIYWKKTTKLNMSKWDLWEKDLINHVPTVDEYFNYINSTTKGRGYTKAIDELYKIKNQKFISHKMKEYIEKNIEKVKIDAFLRINGNIIAECASKINQYVSVNYNTCSATGTELSRMKQDNMYKARAILDKYLPPIKGDNIIQIGTCLKRQGDKHIYKRHILTLGTCNDIPDAEVVVCKDEGELILKWKKLLEDEDVDIMLGYNNYEFDYPYIWKRAEETGVLDEYRTLSKFKDKLSYIREKKLSSSALGDNVWDEIDNVGRAHIDLMRVIRDDVTINLDRYTLEFVSSVFMRGGVSGCVYNENTNTTYICTNSTNGLYKDSYIKLSYTKCHTDDFYNDGEKLQITEIIDEYVYNKQRPDGTIEEVKTKSFIVKGHVNLDVSNKYSWTMAKDDVSPADIFRLQKGSAKDRHIIAKYCLKDVVLTVELFDKLTVIVNKTGMANVCSVPLMWIFTRGQTAKTYSLVSKECRELGYIIPTLYKKSSGGYAGAVVLPPNPGIYVKRPVAVLDLGHFIQVLLLIIICLMKLL